MADAPPTDAGGDGSKFGWSILPDGTGVAVHVQGVQKVVVTPDSANRRFNAEFAADTGLQGSPAARVQMNAYMRRTTHENADELGRQLKEARKHFRSTSADNQKGWTLIESDHLEFDRHVIAAFFVADRALLTEVVSDLPPKELQRVIKKHASEIPIYFDTGANCTVVPAKEAKELGLEIQEGTKASVMGVGGAQASLGVTMFPSMVQAELGGKTVNANIDLKAQVMDGPSVDGKVIAGASQFITQFDGAALLVLDPATKEWGGMMVMPHGARLALSINETGMMVLGGDPAVCKGGQISVMPSVERVCAEPIKREATGSGRNMKEVLGAVAGLVKATSVPVRKKEAHTAAKLGNKVVHSEQGQAGNPWSCMQHETTDASDANSDDTGSRSGGDSEASFSMPGRIRSRWIWIRMLC